MLALQALTLSALFYAHMTLATPQSHVGGGGGGMEASAAAVDDQLDTCAQQLSKYRKFILHAILSFEDVCDAYNTRPLNNAEDYHLTSSSSSLLPESLFHHYQPVPQRTEIWAFFKLLMAQFNDLEFSNVIRDAVIERCRIKSQLQRDEKRNSVVLGKKQRFHSWGGKRSQAAPLDIVLPSSMLLPASDEVHNYY